MSTQVQYRRGTATENNAFTGALAEITVDTTNWTLRVHDGATAGGGGNIATVAYVTAQIAALSANSITDGTSNVKVYNSGNIAVTVAGTANVAIFKSTGANITGTLDVSGNVTGGNLVTGAQVVATGNITGGNLVTAGQVAATGNVTGGNLNVTGNIVDTGALSIISGSNGNITLAPNGTGVIVANTDIRNGQANGVGNIGSLTGYFNTAFVKATSAQYADLAEMYRGDQNYMPGTVVEFGGTHEVTMTTTESSTRVAGVVSTNPSYLMNSGLNDLNSVPVALTGRVPCQVLGPVRKGDRLVSSVLPGVAQAMNQSSYQPGCIIGKSLEDWTDSSVKSIEVVVGRV